MKSNFLLLQLLCLITVTGHSQDIDSPSLKLGDPAPVLRVNRWLKGEPIQQFEKGRIYVVEFWATWCKPCRAAMPHLSRLATDYKNKLTVIGIDVYEMKTTSIDKVKAFVDSMGNKMDYSVATQDSNFIVRDWLAASGEQDNGIPRTFVVNAEGKLAWIGHPMYISDVLYKMVNNKWDIKEEAAKEKSNRYLEKLDDSVGAEVIEYSGNADRGDLGKPDSVLLLIDKITSKEPRLKYAPRLALYTFSALLKTDFHKACEYGKMAIVTPTYDEPAYDAIINAINICSVNINLSAEIYELGAEAYQKKIDEFPFPELLDACFIYKQMAAWYSYANDKSKAIEAQQKAIEALKNKNEAELAIYESQLEQYKKSKDH